MADAPWLTGECQSNSDRLGYSDGGLCIWLTIPDGPGSVMDTLTILVTLTRGSVHMADNLWLIQDCQRYSYEGVCAYG